MNKTKDRFEEHRTSPPVRFAKQFGSLTSTMIELAELQFELLKDDLAESKRRLLIPVVLSALALAAALGFFPIALVALGYLLIELFELPHSAAMIIAASCGLVIGGILFFIAIKLFARAADTFEHSKSELVRNVNWIKMTLRSGE